MLSILIVWVVIAVFSYLSGKAAIVLLGLSREKENIEWDLSIVAGLCITNLFAQVYSIFAGVGAGAFILLTVLSLAAALYLKKKKLLAGMADGIKGKFAGGTGVALMLILLACLLWTDLVPQHYDTYLYHAQAIHWIEKYGLVKGLGNLHFRLAYNSALMPLQAIYSFAWLGGQSLHAVNGFFTAFILVYTALNICRNSKGIQTSDVLGIGMMIYVLYDSFHVSSPNTDTIALLLIYYIITKWQRYSESEETDPRAYGLLCIFIVYATTIKLSVGVMVLLVIYPAVMLIKDKNIKMIIKYLLTGTVLLIPYIVRNALISGYLLYPYEATALKSADWRMSEATLVTDRAEIIAWARGNYNITRNDEHIWQWFAEWFLSINILWKLLFVISVLAIAVLLLGCIRDRKKFRITEYNLIAVCICGMVFWLATAPLPRYGTIYVITLPCIATGMLLGGLQNKYKELSLRLTGYAWMASLAVYLLLFPGYVYVKDTGRIPILIQADYANHETTIEKIGDIEIAVPVKGDQTGYNPFPSAPYTDTGSRIELRGATLKDGFRKKDSN